MSRKKRTLESLFLLSTLLIVVIAVVFYVVVPPFTSIEYTTIVSAEATAPKIIPPVVHITTPVPVKAIYMSQCLASDRSLRAKLVDLVNHTELNTLVIDIKDYGGKISFPTDNPMLKERVSTTCFASDMMEFIDAVHRDGIYVVGRVTVFQDSVMAKEHPELAVKFNTDRNKNWTDRKGINYIDPGAKGMWDYIIELSRESYRIGFDEINFDYVRFPSDGDMTNIYYPTSEAVVEADPVGGKSAVLRSFFSYLSRELKKEPIIISADLFGMTTTNNDDLNIGQVLEDALANFDYVSPMVYPSHYPANFLGFANPATKQYEVVKYSMDSAVRRASTTPFKLRPWLQDFSLGATYTPDMVRTQMQAVYDSGLNSWMLWNASNRYTAAALDEN